MNLFVMLFVALILIALAVWAVPQLLAAIGVPPNVATIIYVGLVCLIVLWLVSVATGYGPSLRLR
jgi:uncharacterized membrane protein